MQDRKTIGVKILAILFNKLGRVVSPNEPLIAKFNPSQRREFEIELNTYFGTGNIPRHISTPQCVANWIGDCNSLPKAA